MICQSNKKIKNQIPSILAIIELAVAIQKIY